MSSDPKNDAAIGSAADSAKAAKRAEIERTVAAARAKLQEEKAIEREKQRIEQEKEARRQAQVRDALLEAQREKDEALAKALAQKQEQELLVDQEHRAGIRQLLQNPVVKIREAKVFSVTSFK